MRGVPRKRCSENMQQNYRRTPMPKCDFNNVEIDPSNEANLKFFRKKQVVGAKFLAKLQASNCKKDQKSYDCHMYCCPPGHMT